jgi:histidinol-phosphate aminotransferase
VGCSPAVRRALGRMTGEQLAMYPEYQASTARLAKFFGVRTDELLLSNGVDDALHLIADVYLEPGATLLLPEPTFDMYRFYAELAGARVVAVRYGDDMRFPLAGILRELRKKPRVLCIANPNNPTGTLVSLNALRKLLRVGSRTLILVDEAYFDFSGQTILPWIRKYPNLIVSRTFSKAAGLAGLRLGCLFAEPQILITMASARTPFPVNTAALIAAEASIKDPGHIKKYVREILLSRPLLSEGLTRLGVRVFPSRANFILADFGPGAGQLVGKLERQGILLRARRDFPREGFVRISVGTRAETRKVLRAIEALQ